MDIKHPRRILVLAAPELDVRRVLKDLTGSAPPPDTSGSLAGASHEWTIKTAYYTANVPIWIDELADVEQWKADFLRLEAKEVIEAVGGWIFCFSNASANSDYVGEKVETVMKAIEEVIEQACGYNWDGTRIALDMSSRQPNQIEALEEQCLEHSFEYVHADSKGRNEFGEPTGIERVKEALETNDWNTYDSESSEQEDAQDDFDVEKAQLNSELWGLKASLLESDTEGEDVPDDEEFKVENMEQMMSQLLAIRETTSSMPEKERKAFASRAVSDLMKDM